MDNNSFYCYSTRMHNFLLSMKFKYVSTGINGNTNKRYWTYKKSEKLDSAIQVYNKFKHDFKTGLAEIR